MTSNKKQQPMEESPATRIISWRDDASIYDLACEVASDRGMSNKEAFSMLLRDGLTIQRLKKDVGTRLMTELPDKDTAALYGIGDREEIDYIVQAVQKELGE